MNSCPPGTGMHVCTTCTVRLHCSDSDPHPGPSILFTNLSVCVLCCFGVTIMICCCSVPQAGPALWACVAHSSCAAASNSSVPAWRATASAACGHRASWTEKPCGVRAERFSRGMGLGLAHNDHSRAGFSARVAELAPTALGA